MSSLVATVKQLFSRESPDQSPLHRETPRRLIRVGEKTESSRWTVRWMAFLERRKNDPYELAVPLDHPAYTDAMEAELAKLDEGDTRKMRFTNVHPEEPIEWVCSEIATEDDGILATQSISYVKPR